MSRMGSTGPVDHAHVHSRGHHPGGCGRGCRSGHLSHHHPHGRLYRGRGTRQRELRKFEAEYGREKGRRVYGAVIGKVRREQVRSGARSPIERVRPHTGRRGRRRFRVRGYRARIRPL